MAHLIDKDTLVAEIKRRAIEAGLHDGVIAETREDECYSILSLIECLEVKEVDLEKELNDFIEQQKAWIKDDRVVEYDNGDSFNHIYDLEEIAKHFFELGLNTQHSSINIPNIDDILEEEGVDPFSNEAKIFKESYYMALEKLKAQKGE